MLEQGEKPTLFGVAWNWRILNGYDCDYSGSTDDGTPGLSG
jgi:hypothetical protein